MLNHQLKNDTMPELLTDTLPEVRVTPTMKAELQKIADSAISNRLSDHIRLAVKFYIERHKQHNN